MVSKVILFQMTEFLNLLHLYLTHFNIKFHNGISYNRIYIVIGNQVILRALVNPEKYYNLHCLVLFHQTSDQNETEIPTHENFPGKECKRYRNLNITKFYFVTLTNCWRIFLSCVYSCVDVS